MEQQKKTIQSFWVWLVQQAKSLNTWLEELWKVGGWRRAILVVFFLLLPTTVAMIVSGQSLISVFGEYKKEKNLRKFIKVVGVWMTAWLWLFIFYGIIAVQIPILWNLLTN